MKEEESEKKRRNTQ